jgi:trigger factor
VKITAEKDEQSQFIVRIEIDPSEFEDAKGKAAKRLSNQVRIPGFRPGKAPRALVERIVGQEALVEEATKILMPKAYTEALEKHDIKPIGDPELEIESQEPLTIKAIIPVEPTVVLGDYASIRKDLIIPEVSEDEAQKVLDNLREQQSTWEEPETERPAQDGDRVELEMVTVRDGEVAGEPFNRTGVLGKGELLGQIDEQVAGMALGEEKVMEVARTKPEPAAEDEEAEEEAEDELVEDEVEEEEDDTPMTFKVTLKSIKVQNMPELDDTFAASVSDLQTLAELKERILTNLKNQKENDAKRDLVDKFVEEVVGQSVIQVPPKLVHAEIHALEENFAERLKQQKLTLDQYLQIVGKDHEAFHEELRPQAVTRINTALVLREIATREGIAVSGEETDREVERMVDEYNVGTPEEQRTEQATRLRQVFNQKQMRENLSENLFSRKLAERLLEISTGGAVPAAEVPAGDAAEATAVAEETETEAEAEAPKATAKPKESKGKSKAADNEADAEEAE